MCQYFFIWKDFFANVPANGLANAAGNNLQERNDLAISVSLKALNSFI